MQLLGYVDFSDEKSTNYPVNIAIVNMDEKEANNMVCQMFLLTLSGYNMNKVK